MRLDWRWVFGAIVALAVGAIGAKPYARWAAPYYQVVAEIIAEGRPWQIVDVEVTSLGSSPGAILRLKGVVREFSGAKNPAAWVVGKLQVAAVVESPLIFWTMLILWPAASYRQRLARLALGVPLFLSLEAATTVCQLLNPLAYASAVLAGDPDPLTPWDRWSRFLEAGGRVALTIAAVILTVSMPRSLALFQRYGKLGKHVAHSPSGEYVHQKIRVERGGGQRPQRGAGDACLPDSGNQQQRNIQDRGNGKENPPARPDPTHPARRGGDAAAERKQDYRGNQGRDEPVGTPKSAK
jgi:hypothetical protein